MRYTPTLDKYCNPEIILEKGGSFMNQTNANVWRAYNVSTTGTKYSVSAFNKTFSDIVNFSVYSYSGSTSAYWQHAITYMTNYNDYVNYQKDALVQQFPTIVVMNIAKKDYGDRIKKGSLKISVDNREYLFNRINYNMDNFSYENTVDLNNDTLIDAFDSFIADNGTSANNLINIISATAFNDSHIFDISLSSLSGYFYFYPFFNESNEVLFWDKNTSLTSSKSFIGKAYPYNGFAVLTDDFINEDVAKIFVNSITAVEYQTELTTTELNTYIIKEPYQLNGSRNPSALQSLTGAGYSWGRDGIDGASSLLIESLSASNLYSTSIGFYNEQNELLMVAKITQPIRLIPDMPYSFKVPLDLVIK